MPLQHCRTSLEAGDCRLGDDGLEKGCDELAQETPDGRPRQAAASKRGESSNASMSGSSKRMTKR
jgi:hypothetical protein